MMHKSSKVYNLILSCWLSTEKGLIWAFLGPALGVALVRAIYKLEISVQCILLIKK